MFQVVEEGWIGNEWVNILFKYGGHVSIARLNLEILNFTICYKSEKYFAFGTHISDFVKSVLLIR